MSNVRALSRPVDPDVVRFIEQVLERAKAGEISGVLMLSQDTEGVAYGIAGIKDRFTVLGWLSHAMHKLQDDEP